MHGDSNQKAAVEPPRAHRDGTCLFLAGTLTMDTVPTLAHAAREACAQGIETVDFAAVNALDSAAIALALELNRHCDGRLRFLNLPPAALKLANLYSVADQLGADA